ncbi:MAG: hypothetical protein AAF266_07360, partial [Planctomycetota bacterium]
MKHATLCLALILISAQGQVAPACPFCAAESRTLTEEMNDSSVAILAKLTAPSEASKLISEGDVPYGFVDPDTGAASFTVESVLLGEPLMEGVEQIEAVYFGEPDTERSYFIRGVGDPPDWAIPLPLSEIATAYVPKLLDLPESGADRLAFFQDYLEHEDPLLGQDAYDEFARAPYQDVIDLAPRMDRDQLRAWIEDYSVSPSRRRLFLTMLGVCGEPEDVQRLRQMLTSDGQVLGPATDAATSVAMATGGSPAFGMAGEMVRFAERQRKLGLDALIACYLTLAGKHGDASEAPPALCDPLGCTLPSAAGPVAIPTSPRALAIDCTLASLVLTARIRQSCTQTAGVTREDLTRMGAAALNFTPDDGWSVRWARPHGPVRAW